MSGNPRITFGMIVLNGEPFISYNLRSLYPFAHQIVVVEGACPAAACVATPDGHSTDTTLETIRAFKREEDPDGKVILVTAEEEGHPNGFWPGEKHEQSQAYAKRATGEWLWQVDVDEFYTRGAVEQILAFLEKHPDTTSVYLSQVTFWGGLEYACDSWYLRRGLGIECPRIFRWGEGYSYASHRPPTVKNADGNNVSVQVRVGGSQMRRADVYFFHYSLMFPVQVRQKGEYYRNAPHAKREKWDRWMADSFFTLRKPYHVHNMYEYPSWLCRFKGEHPAQVIQMMTDINDGKVTCELRPTEDIEELLNSWWYPIGRLGLVLLEPVGRAYRQAARLQRVPGKLQKLLRSSVQGKKN